MAFHNVIKSQ
ncbi:Protein of unknown function [Leuconostoc citreum]|nr:Protein of unknown function [Leuconostoc citreum]